MTTYQSNNGQEIGLDQLWEGIEEHCVALEGAALILEKQLLCHDVYQVQKAICFVLKGLAQIRTTLHDKYQPTGFTVALKGDQIVTVPIADENDMPSGPNLPIKAKE